MGTTETTFDVYADFYAETVNESVKFGGQDVEFYARAKVAALNRINGRLGRPARDIRALDVGCGAGLTDELLLPHVATLDGVDVSVEMVTRAAERNPKGTYQVYDGDRLPFDDGQFELTFAACVLHHVPPGNWPAFLRELWRVTARSGAAVVIEHNPINPMTRRAVRACPFDADAVLARPGPIARTFRDMGAKLVERRYVTFFPVDLLVTRNAERALGWLPLGAQYIITAFR